jgi:peptidoglycan hydrolase CwlO-like protein
MCCGGIKKFVLVAGLVVALGAALFGFTKVGSYFGTAWKQVRQSASNQVPIEFEIERLKNEISQLMPDLKKNLSIVAEEMAAVERLEKDIQTTQGNMEKQKGTLLTMARDLETKETSFIYGPKVYSRDDVARKLTLDWKSYRICESELKTKEQVLDAKKRALAAAKEQLNSIKEQEQQLKLQIAELEAELKNVRLAQTKSRFSIDDSRLSEVKRSIEELRFRLDKERKEATLQAEFFGNQFAEGIDTPAPRPVSEIAKEIREQLEGSKVVEQK